MLNSRPSGDSFQLNRKFGWIPDVPDKNDQLFKLVAPVYVPKNASLRSSAIKVVDQGPIGSCVGNSTSNLHYFVQIKEGAKNPQYGSRLFVYYNTRKREGTVKVDAGCMIRNAIKSITKEGICPEKLWAYDPEMFDDKPPAVAYAEALNHQAITYSRLMGLQQCKECIASGYPFVFGFSVYESFMGSDVARTGKARLPKKGERLLGGHAVMAVGYDDATKMLLCLNSWGISFGDKGYFYLPYEFILEEDLSDDFWTIKRVEI